MAKKAKQRARRPTREGPFVQVAGFCDHVIEDKTDTLSLIRLIDRVFHRAPSTTPGVMEPFHWNGTLVISLKAGSAQGSHRLRVVPVDSSQQTLPSLEVPILFESPDRGISVVLRVAIDIQYEGIYWFDVYLGDSQLLTRIPLRVVFQELPRTGGGES